MPCAFYFKGESYMSEIKEIAVTSVEAFTIDDSKMRALIGLNTDGGSRVVLAATEDKLIHIISGFVGALGAFAKPKLADVERPAISADWFEIGVVKYSRDIALTLRMPNGGALTYVLPRSMAEQLQQSLTVAVGQTDITPPPGTLKQ
jgi:hypothetical protein